LKLAERCDLVRGEQATVTDHDGTRGRWNRRSRGAPCSWWSCRTCGAGRAVVALTGSEKKAEQHEACDTTQAILIACHDLSPCLVWRPGRRVAMLVLIVIDSSGQGPATGIADRRAPVRSNTYTV
jgi:hypothetical protein